MKKSNLPVSNQPLGAGQFFGATRVQFRTGEFVATAVTHPLARAVPAHVHAHPFFSMLVSGRYREWFGKQHWDARPLGIVLRPPEAEHRDEIGPGGAAFLCVDVAPDYWNSLTRAGIRFERRAFEGRALSLSALRLLGELHRKRPGWKESAETLVNELVDEYTAESRQVGRREPRWLKRALERLHADPLSASLSEIARELDLHPVHVTRMFRRHLGTTLSRFQKALRLHLATRAVLEGAEPLADVALDHGYADQSHLTRAMQRATGWTPGRLRCACERLR